MTELLELEELETISVEELAIRALAYEVGIIALNEKYDWGEEE